MFLISQQAPQCLASTLNPSLWMRQEGADGVCCSRTCAQGRTLGGLGTSEEPPMGSDPGALASSSVLAKEEEGICVWDSGV